MRIGIDFRAMQRGHELRGIGEVLRSAGRQLDRRLDDGDEFVAFFDPAGPPVEATLAKVFGPDRHVGTVAMPGSGSAVSRLRGPLSEEQAAIMEQSCDILLQFDFQLGLPTGVPSVLVVHDQIPLELGDWYPAMYLPRYRAARRRGMDRRAAGERAMRRWLYVQKLTIALQRAHRVILYSQHSRATTLRFAARHGVRGLEQRIQIVHLGHQVSADEPPKLSVLDELKMKAFGLADVPFVFYIGGADERRRIDLVVAAFNQIRAAGTELKLVLAGDTFGSLGAVGSEAARSALLRSSYLHDIHLLGYINAGERAWLYDHAAAFVFPSEYEGFGLPVVEALATGCAVVAFDTTSIPEVSGPNCRLVEPTWPALVQGITETLGRAPEQAAADAEAGAAFAARFTWDDLGAAMEAQVEAARAAL